MWGHEGHLGFYYYRLFDHRSIWCSSKQPIECGGSGALCLWRCVIKGNEALFAGTLAFSALSCHIRDLATMRSYMA